MPSPLAGEGTTVRPPELGNRRDHVVRRGIYHLGRSELPGELASLGCDVDGDDARAHLDGQLRRGEAHRALAEDGDRFAALQLQASQRARGIMTMSARVAGCPETIPAHYDRHPPCLGKNCSRLICLPAPHAFESTLGTLFTAASWNQIRKPSRTIGTLGISPASA